MSRTPQHNAGIFYQFFNLYLDKSEAVLGAVSLVSPLEYSGDHRPYFTIYDPDYRLYQEEHEKKVVGDVILGVTNPLFLKVQVNHRINELISI